jgi:endoglucanase
MKQHNHMQSAKYPCCPYAFYHPYIDIFWTYPVITHFTDIYTGYLTDNGDQAPKAFRPFPQHTTYLAGTIKPNHVNQAQLDQAVKDFYQIWKAKYLKQHPLKTDQYYVAFNIEEQFRKNIVSVSESHGHGMLFTVIMAGDDPKEKVYFDGLYRFYKAHPSEINPALMAWIQIKDEKGDIVNGKGADSATDGDMDIAYSLLLAHYQWGSKGTIDYLRAAQKLIHAIMKDDVNQIEWVLKLGDWVKNDDPKYGTGTRPSDFMMNHLKAFRIATGDSKWIRVIDQTYTIINQIFDNYSANTGLLPDFAFKRNDRFIPAPPNYLDSCNDGNYSWNACRVPWRLPLDYLLMGDSRAIPILTRLNTWIKTKTAGDPAKILTGYYLNGAELSYGHHLAFISPFAVSAMIHANNQEWLNNIWTYMNHVSPDQSNYYGNAIKLLCMIVLSHNWWFPQSKT